MLLTANHAETYEAASAVRRVEVATDGRSAGYNTGDQIAAANHTGGTGKCTSRISSR